MFPIQTKKCLARLLSMADELGKMDWLTLQLGILRKGWQQ